jgi:hypothetical protein
MRLKKQVWVAMAVIIAHLSSFLPTATAQYDGSFDAIYFNRTFSPKSEALGRSGVAVMDNAFSLQTNSSLVGHMSGYSLSYSYSDYGNYQFIGLTADIGHGFSMGFSEAKSRIFDEDFYRIQTVSFIANPIPSTSISVDARNFTWKNDIQFGEQSFDADQWYMNLNASYSKSYTAFNRESVFIGGVRLENVFKHKLSLPFGAVELPQIASFGFSNTSTLYKRPDHAWANYVDLGVIGEYSGVFNGDYRTHNSRISAGAELDLSGYIKARVGYLFHSTSSEMYGGLDPYEKITRTYGFGAMLPISQLAGISRDIRLEIDYAGLHQPFYTRLNYSNFGELTMLSATLKVEL